jgi:hypothetical protein
VKRITTTTELADGRPVTAVMTRDHILVDINGRACLAHRRWFDRAEAAELMRSLAVFVGEEAT